MWDEFLLMSQVCLEYKLLGWWRSGSPGRAGGGHEGWVFDEKDGG